MIEKSKDKRKSEQRDEEKKKWNWIFEAQRPRQILISSSYYTYFFFCLSFYYSFAYQFRICHSIWKEQLRFPFAHFFSCFYFLFCFCLSVNFHQRTLFSVIDDYRLRLRFSSVCRYFRILSITFAFRQILCSEIECVPCARHFSLFAVFVFGEFNILQFALLRWRQTATDGWNRAFAGVHFQWNCRQFIKNTRNYSAVVSVFDADNFFHEINVTENCKRDEAISTSISYRKYMEKVRQFPIVIVCVSVEWVRPTSCGRRRSSHKDNANNPIEICNEVELMCTKKRGINCSLLSCSWLCCACALKCHPMTCLFGFAFAYFFFSSELDAEVVAGKWMNKKRHRQHFQCEKP